MTGFTLRTWERTRNQLLAPSMGSGDLKLTTTSRKPIGTHSLIPRPSPPSSFNITLLLLQYVKMERRGIILSCERGSGSEGESGEKRRESGRRDWGEG